MATISYPATGSISSIKKVKIVDAFVQNSSVEAEIAQPAGSVLVGLFLKCISEPTLTVHSASDLGLKIGTTTGGTEVFDDSDCIINAAGNTTALKTGAYVNAKIALLFAGAAIASETQYTDTARTLFVNTLASDHAIAAGGTVEIILVFDVVGA